MQDYINTQGRRRAEANIEMLTSLMENPPKDLKDTIDFFYQIKSGPGLTDADFKSTNKGLSGIFKDFSKKEQELNQLISQIPAEQGLKCSQTMNRLKQEMCKRLLEYQSQPLEFKERTDRIKQAQIKDLKQELHLKNQECQQKDRKINYLQSQLIQNQTRSQEREELAKREIRELQQKVRMLETQIRKKNDPIVLMNPRNNLVNSVRPSRP